MLTLCHINRSALLTTPRISYDAETDTVEGMSGEFSLLECSGIESRGR